MYLFIFMYTYTYKYKYRKKINIYIYIYRYILVYVGVAFIVIDLPVQCLLSATKPKVYMDNRFPVDRMNHARHNAKHT